MHTIPADIAEIKFAVNAAGSTPGNFLIFVFSVYTAIV